MAAETVPASSQSDGRLRIAFVPLTDDPTSVADLDAGDQLTYSFTADGYNSAIAETKVEDKRLTLTTDLSRKGRKTEDIDVKYVDSTTVGSANDVLEEDLEGYLVVRRGVDNATPWTIGQTVDIHTIQCGAQRPDAPVENGVDTISQKLYVTAPTRRKVTLVA